MAISMGSPKKLKVLMKLLRAAVEKGSTPFDSAAATTPRLIMPSIRAIYLAGDSSSNRSGRTTDSSLGSWRELVLDAMDPGVAGVKEPCRLRSEF
jgi:hypothetical protein